MTLLRKPETDSDPEAKAPRGDPGRWNARIADGIATILLYRNRSPQLADPPNFKGTTSSKAIVRLKITKQKDKKSL
jgi:hypothetical protein